jgi:hypothetical protein
VTTIDCLHIVTTTTAGTTDVDKATKIAVKTDDVITSSRRTAATSVTYLLLQ